MKSNRTATPIPGQVDLQILQITHLRTAYTKEREIDDIWMTCLNSMLGDGGEKLNYAPVIRIPVAVGEHQYTRQKYRFLRRHARHVLYISLPQTSWTHHLLVYITTTLQWGHDTAEDLRDGAMEVLRTWMLVQEGDRTITDEMIRDIEQALATITNMFDREITAKEKHVYARHYNNRLAQLAIEYTDEPTHDAVP